jgi:hypothetical protein
VQRFRDDVIFVSHPSFSISIEGLLATNDHRLLERVRQYLYTIRIYDFYSACRTATPKQLSVFLNMKLVPQRLADASLMSSITKPDDCFECASARSPPQTTHDEVWSDDVGVAKPLC